MEKENDNENCLNQLSLEDIENKGGNSDYIYKFPEGACFEPEKLAHENEIALFVEASNIPSQEKKTKKQYDRLQRDYEELCQKYNELIDNKNNEMNVPGMQNNYHVIPKKEKNESESTFGSAKSDYKFHKLGSNSRDKKNLVYSDIKNEDNGKNLTISNDYDADLDINRDDDFFNQDISYDDKDNNGSLIKNKRYSYFSIHSDENSKYFDNENRKEKENKEGDTYKNNTSKNSGGSKYNNSAKFTGCTSHKGTKLVGLRKHDKTNKEEYSTSPFVEKSKNYIGHHSKTFPRKYKTDNDSNNTNNNILIIPKHEEDFIIMNNNLLLSPKDKDETKKVHKKNRSDIAKIPDIKFEDKNWNEIIEYIKNEEIQIPTQKKGISDKKVNEKDKKNKIFDVLEKEKNKELCIDNDDYRKQKLSQIYIEHENELKIENGKNKKKKLNKIERGNELKIDDRGDYMQRKLSQINIVKGNELKIDNNEYRKRKSSQNYIEHENELTISKSMKEIVKRKSLDKEIEDKSKEIKTLQKQLDTIVNKFKNPLLYIKPKDKKLLINKNIKQEPNIEQEEINKKIDTLIENTIKKEKDWNNLSINKNEKVQIINEEPQKIENIIEKSIELNIDRIYENKNENQLNDKNEIHKLIELSIDRTIPDTKEELIDTADLIPKEIKITTKKVVKKTNVIQARFTNNSVSEQNQIKLDGQEEVKPILEEESQENNRFSVEKATKEEEPKKENTITKEIQIQIETVKEDDSKGVLRTKVVNLEDYKIEQASLYSISPDKEKLKENINKSLELVKNDELSLIPKEIKREIKIVTKKIAKKTNYVYTKFADKKATISPQNQFDIKGVEKRPAPELDIGKTESIEISNENIQNIPKFEEIIKKYHNFKKPEDNVIDIKNQFTINGISKTKKPEENVIDKKTEITLEGIHKEPTEMKEEEMQYEINKDDLCEKTTDTSDLIPKEIKLTLKKTVKKTNVIKNKVINSICSETQFSIDRTKQEITPQENVEKEKIVENTIIKSDWNNCLEKDVQQDNFTIERTPKREEEKEEKDSKLDGDKETNKTDGYNYSTIETTIPVEKVLIRERDWNDLLKVENQQNNFIIERVSDNVYEEYNKLKNEKEEKKQKEEKEEITESKDNAKKAEQKEQTVQTAPIEETIKEKDWNKLLKEDIQQKDFIIEGNVKTPSPISDVSEKLEQKKEKQSKDNNVIEKEININIEGVKAELPQPQIEIEKNIDINLTPAEDLPLDKNKIIENWKNTVSEESKGNMSVVDNGNMPTYHSAQKYKHN